MQVSAPAPPTTTTAASGPVLANLTFNYTTVAAVRDGDSFILNFPAVVTLSTGTSCFTGVGDNTLNCTAVSANSLTGVVNARGGFFPAGIQAALTVTNVFINYGNASLGNNLVYLEVDDKNGNATQYFKGAVNVNLYQTNNAGPPQQNGLTNQSAPQNQTIANFTNASSAPPAVSAMTATISSVSSLNVDYSASYSLTVTTSVAVPAGGFVRIDFPPEIQYPFGSTQSPFCSVS